MTTPVSPELQMFFSLLLQYLIPAVFGVVGVWWSTIAAPEVVKWIKSHASQAQLEQVKTYALLLITAAEQSGLSGQLSASGAAKKQWVLDALVVWLREKKLNKFADDIPSLEKIVEAGVYDLKKIQTPPLFELAQVGEITAPLIPPVTDVG